MKLIIDIPDNVYANITKYCEHSEIVEAIYGYIYRGIPLEQIRDEIEQSRYGLVNDGLDLALKIIDKYRK